MLGISLHWLDYFSSDATGHDCTMQLTTWYYINLPVVKIGTTVTLSCPELVHHGHSKRGQSGWEKHGIGNGDSMTELVHGYSWHLCYTYRWASTQWLAAWWSFSVGKSASVKTGLGWWNRHRSPRGCGQTSIISRSMIPTSHQMKIRACLWSANHWNMWSLYNRRLLWMLIWILEVPLLKYLTLT